MEAKWLPVIPLRQFCGISVSAPPHLRNHKSLKLRHLSSSKELAACRAGVPFSTVEVRFENLKVSASVYMGNRALPTVTNAYRNGAEVGAYSCPYLCTDYSAGVYAGAAWCQCRAPALCDGSARPRDRNRETAALTRVLGPKVLNPKYISFEP